MCVRASAEREVRADPSGARKASAGTAGDSASSTRDLLPPTPPLDHAWWRRLFPKAALTETPWPRLSREKQMLQVVQVSGELLGAGHPHAPALPPLLTALRAHLRPEPP